MIPTFGKALEKYTSIHVDGVGTTSFAGKGRLDMPLDPRIGEMMQSMIDHGYDEFLERVAEARKMTKEEVDKLARGRVWSGRDAKEARLVDSIGNLSDAIASAARRANMKPKYRITFVEKDLTFMSSSCSSFREPRRSQSSREPRQDGPAARRARALGPHRRDPARPRLERSQGDLRALPLRGEVTEWRDGKALRATTIRSRFSRSSRTSRFPRRPAAVT
jgi:ClpP class serine protease